MCNVAACIAEQARMFSQIAVNTSHNPDGAEWKRLSEVMREQWAIHRGQCAGCMGENKLK